MRTWLWLGAPLVLCAAAAAPLACATLETIATNTCGNGVIDPGEDCDTFSIDASMPKGTQNICGDAGAGACHLACGVELADDAGVSACPLGKACSLEDQICRAAITNGVGLPTFAASAMPISARANALRIGDFNGDGVGDLLVVGPTEAHVYKGSSQGFGDSVELPFALTDVGVAKLTGNGYAAPSTGVFAPGSDEAHDDLFFPLNPGIAVLEGLSTGAFTPIAYPGIEVPGVFHFSGFATATTSLMLPAQATPFVFIDAQAFAGHLPSGCDNEGIVLTRVGSALAPIHCFNGYSLSNISRVAVAPLDQLPSAVCPSFAFAMSSKGTGGEGDDHVSVYRPCSVGGVPPDTYTKFTEWDDLGVETDVQLAGGGHVTWGPFTYDLDGDGNLDLIMGTGKTAVQVAYGRADGKFASKPGLPADNTASVYVVKQIAWQGSPADADFGKPLAVGDINGDHLPDFVTDTGIFMSAPPVDLTADDWLYKVVDAASQLSGGSPSFQSAVIGDLNGDGLGDVAATLSTSLGNETQGVPVLLVVLNAGREINGVPLVNVQQVPVDEYAYDVVAGDFDGDGYTDVAFAQTSDASLHTKTPGKSLDGIWIAYGTPGATSDPASMGGVVGITTLVSVDIVPPSGALDGFTDLLVIGEHVGTTDPIDSTAAILNGRPGRLLVAPLSLSYVAPMSASLLQSPVISAAAGSFYKPGHSDLAFIAAPTGAASGVGAGGGDCQIWLAQLTDGAALATGSPVLTTAALDTQCTSVCGLARSATAAFDLDGDGIAEFIALIQPPQQPVGNLCGTVFNGGGSGSPNLLFAKIGQDNSVKTYDLEPPPGSALEMAFGTASALRVAGAHLGAAPSDLEPYLVVLNGTSLSVYADPMKNGKPIQISPNSLPVTDFALLPRVGYDGFSDLVVLTLEGAFLVRAPDFSSTFALCVAGGDTIAAGDVDGDRLPDIVVGNSANNQIVTYRMAAGQCNTEYLTPGGPMTD